MRVKAAILLLLLVSAGLAACGRRDVPAYPPDAVLRPGTAPERGDPIRYY
jgi:hypothetical protein